MATLTSLREKTSVAGDDLLYLDDSETAIGSTYDAKVKWSTLKNDIDAFDIYDDVDTLATPATDDRFIFADVSASGEPNRYTTLSGLKTALGADKIDIHANVSTAATPTGVDRLIFSDESETNDPTRYVTFDNFKTALSIDEFEPSNSGSTGQYLQKTSTGYQWATIPTYTSFAPSNSGSAGQYLVKTASGYNWSALPAYPSGFSPSNSGTTGQYLVKTATGYSWQAAPSGTFSPDNTGIAGQFLKKTSTGYQWDTLSSEFLGYYEIVKTASDIASTVTEDEVLFIGSAISDLTGKPSFISQANAVLSSLSALTWFEGQISGVTKSFDSGVALPANENNLNYPVLLPSGVILYIGYDNQRLYRFSGGAFSNLSYPTGQTSLTHGILKSDGTVVYVGSSKVYTYTDGTGFDSGVTRPASLGGYLLKSNDDILFIGGNRRLYTFSNGAFDSGVAFPSGENNLGLAAILSNGNVLCPGSDTRKIYTLNGSSFDSGVAYPTGETNWGTAYLRSNDDLVLNGRDTDKIYIFSSAGSFNSGTAYPTGETYLQHDVSKPNGDIFYVGVSTRKVYRFRYAAFNSGWTPPNSVHVRDPIVLKSNGDIVYGGSDSKLYTLSNVGVFDSGTAYPSGVTHLYDALLRPNGLIVYEGSDDNLYTFGSLTYKYQQIDPPVRAVPNLGSITSFAPSNSGSTGQILTKTSTGYNWADAVTAFSVHDVSATGTTIADADYLVFSDESASNDPNTKITFSNFKTALDIDEFSPSNSGSTGQYLVKTSTGYNWATLPSYPTGFDPSNSGSTGQILTKTSGGYNWQDAPDTFEVHNVSATGTTIDDADYLVFSDESASNDPNTKITFANFKTALDIDEFAPSNTGSAGQILAKTSAGYQWITNTTLGAYDSGALSVSGNVTVQDTDAVPLTAVDSAGLIETENIANFGTVFKVGDISSITFDFTFNATVGVAFRLRSSTTKPTASSDAKNYGTLLLQVDANTASQHTVFSPTANTYYWFSLSGGNSRVVNKREYRIRVSYVSEPEEFSVHGVSTTATTIANNDYLVFSDESATDDVNTKITFANFKTALSIDEFSPSNSGSTGQILTKTSGGYNWADAPISLPSGGTNGQYLQRTSTGYTWATIPTYTSFAPSNSGSTGQILTKTSGGYNWQDAPDTFAVHDVSATGTTIANDDYLVFSDESATNDVNTKITFANFKTALSIDEFSPSNSGSTNDVLTKTSTGYSWQAASGGSSTFEGLYDIIRTGSDLPSTIAIGDNIFVANALSSTDLTGKPTFKSKTNATLAGLSAETWYRGTAGAALATPEFRSGSISKNSSIYFQALLSNDDVIFSASFSNIKILSGDTFTDIANPSGATNITFGGTLSNDDTIWYSGDTDKVYTLSDGVFDAGIAYPTGEVNLGFKGVLSNNDSVWTGSGTDKVYTLSSGSWDSGVAFPTGQTGMNFYTEKSNGDQIWVGTDTYRVYTLSSGSWDSGVALPAGEASWSFNFRGLLSNGDLIFAGNSTSKLYTFSNGAFDGGVAYPSGVSYPSFATLLSNDSSVWYHNSTAKVYTFANGAFDSGVAYPTGESSMNFGALQSNGSLVFAGNSTDKVYTLSSGSWDSGVAFPSGESSLTRVTVLSNGDILWRNSSSNKLFTMTFYGPPVFKQIDPLVPAIAQEVIEPPAPFAVHDVSATGTTIANDDYLVFSDESASGDVNTKITFANFQTALDIPDLPDAPANQSEAKQYNLNVPASSGDATWVEDTGGGGGGGSSVYEVIGKQLITTDTSKGSYTSHYFDTITFTPASATAVYRYSATIQYKFTDTSATDQLSLGVHHQVSGSWTSLHNGFHLTVTREGVITGIGYWIPGVTTSKKVRVGLYTNEAGNIKSGSNFIFERIE